MLTERIAASGRATTILRDLVAIESVNPFFPGGERGEIEMARYVADYFADLGLDPQRQEALPARENVWARLDVPGASRTLLLESHMDTVTIEPIGRGLLEPAVRDGRMSGRGSCDTKASLAAMLTALAALVERRDQLKANVIVLGSVDEEYLMRGIGAFAGLGLPIDAAVVGEPTSLNVVRAHKGLVRWTIEAHGRAAHTSRPENGVNAIDHMIETIGALRQRFDAVLPRRQHPLLGSPTFTVATIRGGTGVNIVPELCAIDVDRRTLPAESTAEVIAELHDVLAELRRRRPDLDVRVGEPFASIPGLDTPANEPFVQLATRIAHQHGGRSEPVGVPYGTNAWALAGRGIPTIVLGPGDIAQAHSADEWVDLAQVERAAELYVTLALAFDAA